MNRKKIFKSFVISILISIIIFCVWKLQEEISLSREIKELDKKIEKYMPIKDGMDKSNLLELMKVNPDVRGWIIINDTNINYPILKSNDNNFYLSHNALKEESKAGSIFMDFRCNDDFTSFNSIIYGHQLKSGEMFGDIRRFRDEDYFNSHKTGLLFTAYQTYEIEIFSYILTKSDSYIYEATFLSSSEKEKHLNKIYNDSIYINDIDLNEEDKILTLSTCSYEFEEARSIVVARLVKYNY